MIKKLRSDHKTSKRDSFVFHIFYNIAQLVAPACVCVNTTSEILMNFSNCRVLSILFANYCRCDHDHIVNMYLVFVDLSYC